MLQCHRQLSWRPAYTIATDGNCPTSPKGDSAANVAFGQQPWRLRYGKLGGGNAPAASHVALGSSRPSRLAPFSCSTRPDMLPAGTPLRSTSSVTRPTKSSVSILAYRID